MSGALAFIGPRVALVDTKTGQLTRDGLLFFQAVWIRAGGANGPSTTDLAAEVDNLAPLAPAVETLPATDDQAPAAAVLLPADEPSGELAALREEVAALRQRVQDLEQRP